MTFYTLQILNTLTTDNCKIQTTDLLGAHIGGNVSINDSNAGENFCGDAGNTTDGATFTNTATSSATSSSTSSTGTAGQNALQKALNNQPTSSPTTTTTKTSTGTVWQDGWGSDLGLVVLLI